MNGKPQQKGLLAELMREGWDRRIGEDYLAWMNDRVDSNAAMWVTGDRDFRALTQEIDSQRLAQYTALELGCGVGRLLRPASDTFEYVIGTDISPTAISKASNLLDDCSGIELELGNGTDLSFVDNSSIDFAYSFGVLSHVPVIVCATYLLELSRVLRKGGILRAQVFLGRCQPTVAQDTVAVRSFQQEAFCEITEGCGFRVEWIRELDVGVEVPDDDWLRPMIVSLIKIDQPSITAEEIEQHLVPGGEKVADSTWEGSSAEYLLNVMRAEELARAGKKADAKRALEFACANYANPDPKLLKLIGEL